MGFTAGSWRKFLPGEVFHQGAPDAVLLLAGADNGHRPQVEESAEILNAHAMPPLYFCPFSLDLLSKLSEGLLGRVPAVDNQFTPGDEFGFIRGQIQSPISDIIRFPDMADGVLGVEVAAKIVHASSGVFGQIRQEGCPDAKSRPCRLFP